MDLGPKPGVSLRAAVLAEGALTYLLNLVILYATSKLRVLFMKVMNVICSISFSIFSMVARTDIIKQLAGYAKANGPPPK